MNYEDADALVAGLVEIARKEPYKDFRWVVVAREDGTLWLDLVPRCFGLTIEALANFDSEDEARARLAEQLEAALTHVEKELAQCSLPTHNP